MDASLGQEQGLVALSIFGVMERRSSFPRVASSLWRVEASIRIYNPFFSFQPSTRSLILLFFFSRLEDPQRNLLFRARVFISNRMVNRSDLPPDSSSIGARVRSKKRVEVDQSKSMDSSNLSLHLTSVAEDLGHATVEGALPAVEVEGLPPVPVYEGFFESGFRDQVPSLVAKISELLGISRGQLNPPSWKTLIALQNLGDLEGLVIGVAEVLHSYFISPLNGGEGRASRRARNFPPRPRRSRTSGGSPSSATSTVRPRSDPDHNLEKGIDLRSSPLENLRGTIRQQAARNPRELRKGSSRPPSSRNNSVPKNTRHFRCPRPGDIDKRTVHRQRSWGMNITRRPPLSWGRGDIS
ncbi:hypothetical protein Bca101_026538 [Brassica carinata]